MFREIPSKGGHFRSIPDLIRVIAAIAIVLPAFTSPVGSHARLEQDSSPLDLITIIDTNLDGYPDGKVPLYSMFEVSFRINADIDPEDENSVNPYDFEEIKVDGCFTPPAPAEELCQPGFFFQEYQAVLDEEGSPIGYEASGDPVWKVRFAPITDAGDHIYNYYLKVQIQGGITDSTPPRTFEVGPPEVRDSIENRGFIRTEDNQRYFRFDNGEPFIGVGLNVGWWENDDQAISMYEGILDDMHAFNANLARVWMTNSVKEGPPDKGWLVANKIMSLQDRALGRQYNLLDAWYFDEIVNMAEERNVYFILTLEDGHQFNSEEWQHGYNLYKPILNNYYDILDFDNALARKYQQQVFRYVVARWGYSTSILSWEFWNEIDELINYLPDPPYTQVWGNMIDWHTRMAAFLRSIDCHGHLIDTSTGSFQLHQDLYMETGMDFAQVHYYYVPDDERVKEIPDMAALTWRYAEAALQTYRDAEKEPPVVIGEFGLAGAGFKGRSEALDSDDQGVHLHNGLWASLMSGMATSGLHWHWHHLWRTGASWLRHYAALSNFFEGVETDGLQVLDPLNEFYPVTEEWIDYCSADLCNFYDTLRVMGLYNDKNGARYLWIQNLDHIWSKYVRSWKQACEGDSVPKSATIFVQNVPPETNYRVEWWDPYMTEKEFQIIDSKVIKTEFDLFLKTVVLKIPVTNLTTDIAIKILPASASILVEKSIVRQGINVGDSVTVTTTITNTGQVELTDITISDESCPQAPIGSLAIGAQEDYQCVYSHVSTDTSYSSTATANYSAPPVSGTVSDGAFAYLYVKDGMVGSGSLESCTEEAFDVDLNTGEIDFKCGSAGQRYTIGLENTKEITGNVSIQGGGNNLSGSNQVRLFDIKPGGNLTLDDIYLVSGAAHRCTPDEAQNQGGGAIRNNGSLTIVDSLLYANSADIGGAIHNYSNGNVTIENSTLMRNNARKDANPENGGDGGAIFNRGNLIIQQSALSNNIAYGGGALIVWNGGTAEITDSKIFANSATNGGAIEVGVDSDKPSLNSSCNLHYSTIYNNKAEQGGGLATYFQSTLSLNNSTLSGNQALDDINLDRGGGILAQGGTIYITDSTITANTSDNGGGINIESGEASIRNTILALNQTTSQTTQPGSQDCSGDPALITSLGSNLVGIADACAWVPAEGDQIGSQDNPVDPSLEPLADNGGLTLTHALGMNSPAIDASNESECPYEDQRHADRSQGQSCDTGAYEMIQLAVNDIEIFEGDEGEQLANMTVSINGNAVQPIEFDFATEDATAIGYSDYLPVSGTKVIPAGSQSVNVDIPVVGDTISEANEFFFFELTRVIKAIARDWRTQVTILDDDTAALQVSDVSAGEPDTGMIPMVFEVSLTVPSVQEISVDYQTVDGTALSGLDYQPVSGKLIFPAGEVTKSVSVNILADDLLEENEFFILRLSNPTNAEIADTDGLGTILENLLYIRLPLVIKD